ncbi:hypothetical protein F5Y14DRAFT_416374 [Nemania sp. NC0429]|nr:hypothetical protein F5Y14DRAFT_416374 [Nemania sp. NC0429]
MAAASKSSAEEVASKDQDKIVVTLSVRGQCPIPKRRLVLTPHRPVVPIGRSSKVQSKGFIPAQDNAWFENPVMSRQHAELIAKFAEDPVAVYMRDVGSFHGTYHTANDGHSKEERVAQKLPVKLTSGDILRFGMDIHRADRSYPPSSIDFSIEEMTMKPDGTPHRAFTVPDYADDEDEISDDEASLAITASHTKSTQTNTEPKGTMSVSGGGAPPIDLTADDDDLPPIITKPSTRPIVNCNKSSDVIDLTSEPNCESDVELRTVDPSVPCPSTGFDIGSPAPVFSNDRASSTVPSGVICVPHGKIAMPPSATAHSDDEDIDEYPDYFSDDDIEHEFSQYSHSESGDSLEAVEEKSEIPEARESSQTRDIPPEMEDGYESGFVGEEFYDNDGLSDADLATNYEDSDGDIYSDMDDYEDHEDDESDEEIDDTDLDTLRSPLFSRETAAHVLSRISPDLLGRTASPKSFASQTHSHARDPSPSDAALVKRHPLLDNAPNIERAQQLGEKSGKFEFFAAREKNRASVIQVHSTIPTPAIRETLQVSQQAVSSDLATSGTSDTTRGASPSLSCVTEFTGIPKETEDSVAQGSTESNEAPEASSIKLSDMGANQYSAWTASGDQFINNPLADEPTLLCSVQCEQGGLDMTSAYKFNQSKLATAAEAVSRTRRLPIQDLLAQEPKQSSVVSQSTDTKLSPHGDSPTSHAIFSNKRSYEEAFDQTTDDVTSNHADSIVTRSPPCITEDNSRDQVVEENVNVPAAQEDSISAQEVINAEDPKPTHETSTVSIQPEDARPAKRMRLATAVQVVACVALGSAATFSYLVNTAPVF